MNAGQTGKYHNENGSPVDAKVVTVHPGNLVDVAVGTKVIRGCRISDGCGGFWPTGGVLAGIGPPADPAEDFVEETMVAVKRAGGIPMQWQVRAALALGGGDLVWRVVDLLTR